MTARRLAILWTATIVVGCLIPGEGLPEVQILSFDKVVHILFFAVFGWLWTVALPNRKAFVVVSGVALGIAIEIAQGALPVNRSPDVFDAVADIVGLLIGVGIGRWVISRRPAA